MIKEIVKSVVDTGKEVAEVSKGTASFNPDKRIEAGKKEAMKVRPSEAKYDPDKRIEPKIKEVSIEKLLKEYIKDIINASESPETLKNVQLKEKDIKRPSMEEMKIKRMEFQKTKDALISQWESANGKEWPRYKKDIYDKNGNKIRNAGERYDAHHIQPLSWGGKNTVSNITPLSAEVHYDHRGVHRLEGAYDRITKKMREA